MTSSSSALTLHMGAAAGTPDSTAKVADLEEQAASQVPKTEPPQMVQAAAADVATGIVSEGAVARRRGRWCGTAFSSRKAFAIVGSKHRAVEGIHKLLASVASTARPTAPPVIKKRKIHAWTQGLLLATLNYSA